MAAKISRAIGRWLTGISPRLFKRRQRRPGRSRLPTVRARSAHPAAAVAAYRDAVRWGERLSRAAQETVELPAYEARALRGERAPQRFQWRRRWYRVADVCASWQDGRRPVPERPEYGRIYFNVVTDPAGLFQLYYDPSNSDRKGHGRWVLYRRTEIRPVRG